MALFPISATRFATEFEVLSGGTFEIQSTVVWPTVTVDYTNEGSTTEPPTRSYAGIIDKSSASSANGTNVAVILPLSNESIFVQDPLLSTGIRVCVRWVNRVVLGRY